MVNLREAYASCARSASGHYENFPVASLFLPRAMRPHVAAVYAFARAADDFADEGVRAADARLALLDGWHDRLRLAAAQTVAQAGAQAGDQAGDQAANQAAVQPAPRDGEPGNAREIFVALAATIRDKQLPVSLFEDLLSAFRQDTTVVRYRTWDDLLDYCRRSANPVGRLVLRIAGHRDPQLDEWSDHVCTALQLTNFWQDLRIDYARGRIYLPLDIMAAHGLSDVDLDRGILTSPIRAVMADVAQRTRNLFVAGRPICDRVAGRLRYELRSTWLGGLRILAHVERAQLDEPIVRPRLRILDAPWFLWHLAAWPART